MQTIQHATNLPYIPQYTIWNYAMEHPILFFLYCLFCSFNYSRSIWNVVKNYSCLCWQTKVVNNYNNKDEVK